MGTKFLALVLSLCLPLLSLYEVSCQDEGTRGLNLDLIKREYQVARAQKMLEEIEREFEEANKATTRKNILDAIKREFEAARSGLKQLKINAFTVQDDDKEQSVRRQSMLDAVERKFEAVTYSFKQLDDLSENKDEGGQYAKRYSMFETIEREFEAARRALAEIMNFEEQGYIKNAGSDGVNQDVELMDASKTGEDIFIKGSTHWEHVEESQHQMKGAWRCFTQGKNDVNGVDSIIIPKYELNDIIKEESIKGSSAKTSSLITSLKEIVDNHKKRRWTDVKIGKISTTETSDKVKTLKASLKEYVGIKVRELVARWDYDEILTMASLYEELTKPPVTYISRLSTYGTVIKEGFKAYQRVETVHQRVILHENVAKEKQERVDAEFELVKALAERGDNLAVQIYAMKKAVLKLEAEKKQADMEFQKRVENLSQVLEESSHAYEKHRVVVREWKEVQAFAEYSLETIEKADVVWVQFLNTL